MFKSISVIFTANVRQEIQPNFKPGKPVPELFDIEFEKETPELAARAAVTKLLLDGFKRTDIHRVDVIDNSGAYADSFFTTNSNFAI